MAVLWSDLQTQLQDYIRTYTTGSLPQANMDRALNRSVEYFQRRLALPSDRRIYKFYFTQDTLYYNLPTGFNEAIGLFYDSQSSNVPANSWSFRPDTDIMAFTGLGAFSPVSMAGTSNRYWGFSTVNQVSPGQIIMVGPNINPPMTIDPLSSIGSWVASGDASNLAVDSNNFQTGSGSLQFTITPSGGTATLSSTPAGNAWDFLNYSQNNGQLKFYVYFGNTVNFTNVQLVLQTSTGNYWTGTMTTNADGTAWTSNQWNKLGVFWNNLVMTGSPSATDIATIKIIFTEGGGFTTTSTMHVNFLFAVVPDYMDLIYYSGYKGHVTNASTDILVFNPGGSLTNNSDTLYFGDYAPDLIGPIAKRAAIEIMPQLRQDKDFMGEYKEEVKEWLNIFGKVYPRKRTYNMGQTKLRRDTLN